MKKRDCQVDSQALKEMLFSSERQLSLACKLRGNLPVTFWNYLIVGIAVKLKIQRQTRQIWNKGFYASVGSKNAKIYLLYTNTEQIDFYIKANCDDKVGHDLIWKYIRIFSDECNRLVTEWWPGLITKKILKCPQCNTRKMKQDINKYKDFGLLVEAQSNTSPADVAEFELDDLWDEDDTEDSCRCDNRCELPVALIKPLPKGLFLY